MNKELKLKRLFLDNKRVLIALSIAMVHFGISFYTDQFIFAEIQKRNIAYYMFDKMVYIVLLTLFWHWIISAICWGIKNHSFDWRLLKSSLIFILLYAPCIVCIYPAVEFGGDMPFFINTAKEYRLNGGLYLISTLLYIIGYMAFPVKGGPTIMMALVSAIANGYVFTKALDVGVKRIYLALLFLPPFILYAIYPTRLTMMTLVFMVYFVCLYASYINNEELTVKKLAVVLLFTGMLSVWRIEGKYLLVFAPLFIILAFRKKLSLKKYAKYFMLCLATYLIFSIPDHFRTITIEDRLHPIVGYMLPLMEMDGVNWRNSEEYDVLNGYIDMVRLREKEEAYGLELYRADYLAALGVIRTEDLTSTKSEYVWAAVRACLDNPIEYIKIRFKVFAIAANGSQFPFNGSMTNEDGSENIVRNSLLYLVNGSRLLYLNPINAEAWPLLWRTFIRWMKNIVWQIWTSLIMMIWLIVHTFKKREWLCFSYTLGLWCYAAVIFLFCPACVFTYYWPVYTYCILYIIFVGGLTRRKA